MAQTFGDRISFHSHLHLLVTDGGLACSLLCLCRRRVHHEALDLLALFHFCLACLSPPFSVFYRAADELMIAHVRL
jgi:hypothetical protein